MKKRVFDLCNKIESICFSQIRTTDNNFDDIMTVAHLICEEILEYDRIISKKDREIQSLQSTIDKILVLQAELQKKEFENVNEILRYIFDILQNVRAFLDKQIN